MLGRSLNGESRKPDLALDSTQALDLAHDLNTGGRNAVLNLYRFNKEEKDNPAKRNYGGDQETLGLFDVLFVILEQFTLLASGLLLTPPPLAVRNGGQDRDCNFVARPMG
jgi:hypothetical protein